MAGGNIFGSVAHPKSVAFGTDVASSLPGDELPAALRVKIDGEKEDVQVEVLRVAAAIYHFDGVLAIEHRGMTRRIETHVNHRVRH